MRTSALLLVVLALSGCGHSAAGFPASPVRLVTDDELSTDVMVSLGFRPVGAVGLTASSWAPALAPYLSSAENLGARTGGSANLDAIAGARPDAIVAPMSLKRAGWGAQLSAEAPTLYYPSRGPRSSWQAVLRALAGPLGLTGRANAVIAGLALRAAAIRAQVEGKTVALLQIVAPQSFSTVDDYDPAAVVFEQDLALRNVHLRPQQYGNGCAARPSPPRACSTNELFAGVLTVVPPVDAALLETGSVGSPAVAAFEATSYYRGLGAVRAGHVAAAPTYEDVGPLGVAYLYSAVERAFGLDELHGTVAGRKVDLTFDPSSRRLCWAGLPVRGAVFSAGAVRESLPSAVGCAAVPSRAAPASGRLGGAVLTVGAPPTIGGSVKR
ncbi:MAG TPA: ABC transporter substrate-binding protein [Gaiellaceae bacterium]|nr:ABC transporter substrate-binding protein [Gaiellaceae bacterium]